MNRLGKKWVTMLLGGALAAQMGLTAFAGTCWAGSGNLYGHHGAYTGSYGCRNSTASCSHVHGEDCWQTVSDCHHVHGEGCGNSQTGFAGCTHICGADTGCVSRTLNCSHVHDGGCGYQAGTPQRRTYGSHGHHCH